VLTYLTLLLASTTVATQTRGSSDRPMISFEPFAVRCSITNIRAKPPNPSSLDMRCKIGVKGFCYV
jgi:hypothetical protein